MLVFGSGLSALPSKLRWRATGVCWTIACVAAPAYGTAQDAVGSEFQVNTYTTSTQSEPGAASVGTAGYFVVTWQSNGQDGNQYGIFGQRFDSGGTLAGAEFQVNSFTSYRQVYPAAAGLGASGNFVVVWRDVLQDGSSYGVFGQRFDSGGNALGTEFQVNTYTTSAQYRPSVSTVGTNGSFVVAWSSGGQDGSSNGVFAQLFTSSGAASGAEFQVNAYTLSVQNFPSVASLGTTGNFVVAWISRNQDGYGQGTFAVVGREVGRHFGAQLSADEWISVNTAGSLPYYSRLPTIDALGLTDATIARHGVYIVSPRWAGHRRGHGAYVLTRRPRVVLFYNSAGSREPHYLGDHQLVDDPFFRFFYQLRHVTLPPPGGYTGVPLARFLGTPFGEAVQATAPELASEFEVLARPVLHTKASSSRIGLHYFERRLDRNEMWEFREATGADLEAFLAAVVRVWSVEALPPNLEARRLVERLGERALRHIEADEIDAAKRLLTEATRLNETARSPIVYRYLANLAVLEKQLFLAVHAQQEALRLDPSNQFLLDNLRVLLTTPWKGFHGSG